MKFCDIVSKEKGESFTLKGFTFTFDRYSAYFAELILKENNLTEQELMLEFQRNPFGIPLQMAFELLDDPSKAEFNNDLITFKKCLRGKDDVTIVLTALEKTMLDALPVAEEEDTEKKSQASQEEKDNPST